MQYKVLKNKNKKRKDGLSDYDTMKSVIKKKSGNFGL